MTLIIIVAEIEKGKGHVANHGKYKGLHKKLQDKTRQDAQRTITRDVNGVPQSHYVLYVQINGNANANTQ